MVIPEHRPYQERTKWLQRDPIALFAARLIAEGLADQSQLDVISQQCAKRLERAIQFMRESPLPQPGDLEGVLYAS
jgi:TPP-dependent pyruvate/acetoin dehydrogenase alpha subunit